MNLNYGGKNMARPNKVGLDYFPFDVDFFEDEKIEAIFVEFGIKGEITVIKLLCAIYRNGYFIQWNERLKIKLLKNLPCISSELLEQIIKRLIKWDFFNEGLFNSDSILTSTGIQKRFFSVAKRRKQNEDYPYLLIDVYNNQFNVNNNLDNVNDNHPKEIKGKKIKEEERKEYPPLTPPAPSGALEEGNFLSSSLSQKDGKPRNLNGLLEEMKRLKISQDEQDQIMKLSGFGEIGHPVWQLINQAAASIGKSDFSKNKIRLPGKFILSKLKSKPNETPA